MDWQTWRLSTLCIICRPCIACKPCGSIFACFPHTVRCYLSCNGCFCKSCCCAYLQKKPTGKLKLLDDDGLANVGQSIEDGDYFINKISPTNTKDPVPMAANYVLPDHMYKPSPMSYKGAKGESSVVDKVMITQNDENEQIFKVRLAVDYLLLQGITSRRKVLQRCSST